MTGQIGHKEFDYTTKYWISPNTEYYFNIYARGDLNVFTGQTTTISGWVDPILEIDPDWVAGHPDYPQFNIEYSAGIGQPVPETSGLLALGLPIAVLGAGRLRRVAAGLKQRVRLQS